VQDCLTARKLRRLDVDTATRALWSAIHGVTSLLIAFPTFAWGDPDGVRDMLIDAVVEGLRPRR